MRKSVGNNRWEQYRAIRWIKKEWNFQLNLSFNFFNLFLLSMEKLDTLQIRSKHRLMSCWILITFMERFPTWSIIKVFFYLYIFFECISLFIRFLFFCNSEYSVFSHNELSFWYRFSEKKRTTVRVAFVKVILCLSWLCIICFHCA